MRYYRLILALIISFFNVPGCNCALNALGNLADTISSNDGLGPLAFGLWYTIPSSVRQDVLEILVLNSVLTGFPPQTATTMPFYERLDRALTFDELEGMVRSQSDLIQLAHEYLATFKYSVPPETSNNLICLIFAKAEPESLAKILETCQIFKNSVSKLDPVNLIKLMDAYGRVNGGSVALLYILERYIKTFEVSNAKVLQVLRAVAVRDDDVELMKFLNGFPDLIPLGNQSQQAFLDYYRGSHPNILPIICNRHLESHPNGPEFFVSVPKMIKFRLFDKPVYVQYWTLDMILLASQEYDLLSKLSPGLRRKSQNSSSRIPNNLQWAVTMEELIPLVPIESIRAELIRKYDLVGKIDPKVWKKTFKTITAQNEATVATVLHPKDQIIGESDYSIIIINPSLPTEGISDHVEFVAGQDAVKFFTDNTI